METKPHVPVIYVKQLTESLRWRHNGRDGVSNHQPHDCLLNRLFGCKLKKTSKLRVTGLCVGNSPGTGEFPAQMASNTENVSIWWCHHDDGVATSDTQPWKHMTTMGQNNAFQSVIMISCVKNIYLWSPKLEWDYWSYFDEVGIFLLNIMDSDGHTILCILHGYMAFVCSHKAMNIYVYIIKLRCLYLAELSLTVKISPWFLSKTQEGTYDSRWWALHNDVPLFFTLRPYLNIANRNVFRIKHYVYLKCTK